MDRIRVAVLGTAAEEAGSLHCAVMAPVEGVRVAMNGGHSERDCRSDPHECVYPKFDYQH